MNKIKVLHINTFDSYGGAAQVANDLISCTQTQNSFLVKYKKTDRDLVIAFTNKNFIDLLFLLIDKLRSLFGIMNPIRFKLGLGDSLNGTYKKLLKIKEYREADIVHLHNIHGGYFDITALVKIAKEKKLVWTLHDMWMMTGGEAATFDNDNYKYGVAQTPFGNNYPLLNPYFDKRDYYMKKKKKIYQQIAKSLHVVPVSYWIERSLRQSYVYENNIAVKTIQNGTNLSIFSNQNLRHWKKPRILFFNFESPFKGSHLFAAILKKIQPEFDLLLIGNKIEGIAPIHYSDFIHSRTKLAEIYNQADILVFPSLAESLPITVLEAMACGVCIVGSDIGGIPEILDEQYAYVFRSGNSEHLLTKINSALMNLEETRQKGLHGEKIVQEKFDLKNCALQYEKLYAEILGDTHR